MADELIMDSKALIFATLADVYLSSGMIDEAISILQDGLTRNPNYTLAKVILGRAYYLKGNIDEALKILQENYESAKGSETLNLYLGHCYKKKGEYEKAIGYYEAVLKINPENREAKESLEVLKPTQPLQKPASEAIVEQPPAKPQPEMVAIPKTDVEPTAPTELLPELGLEPMPARAVEVPAPLEALNEPMGRLLEIKSVKGAFILSRDGLLIQNYYAARTDLEEICALIAGIFNEADEAFKFLKCGALERCIIEKKEETICVITAGESLLCIITKPEAKPGLVFLYAKKIIEEIRKVLG
ncbi:MAG: tetratricopeptide repeat protein [candidate division WOR-3 bacterium]